MTATYGKPEQCEECGLKPNNKADIHWANMTGEYTRERSDYKPLCRWCHLKHDGNDIKSNGGRWGKRYIDYTGNTTIKKNGEEIQWSKSVA